MKGVDIMGIADRFGTGCGGIGGLFGCNSEILFFILVFLLLFWNGKSYSAGIVDP